MGLENRSEIIALNDKDFTATHGEKNVIGLEYHDAPAVARAFIPRLREDGAQIIVILTHYGLSADKKLAQQVPGIDLIVGEPYSRTNSG